MSIENRYSLSRAILAICEHGTLTGSTKYTVSDDDYRARIDLVIRRRRCR